MKRVTSALIASVALVSAGTVVAQGARGGAWEISGTRLLGYFSYGSVKSDGTLDGRDFAPIVSGAPAFVKFEFELPPSTSKNAGMTGSAASCRQIEAEFLKQQKSMLEQVSFAARNYREGPNFLKPTPFPQEVTAFITKPHSSLVTVEIGGTTTAHTRCFYTTEKYQSRPYRLTVYGTYKR